MKPPIDTNYFKVTYSYGHWQVSILSVTGSGKTIEQALANAVNFALKQGVIGEKF